MAEDISVLVVDDSALMRNLISRMVNETPGLHVVETAMNGKFALQKIPVCDPDVIVLDIEMPEMNGIEFLRERKKRGITIPVVVLSSVAEEGAPVTMEALSLGASDFVQKPSGSISTDIKTVKDEVTHRLLAYGGKYKRFDKKKTAPFAAAPSSPESEKLKNALSDLTGINEKIVKKDITPIRKSSDIQVVAIGISTGGPDALRVVFSHIKPDHKQPILVVQHMPPGFTLEFARSLDKICALPVTEAVNGEEIVGGHIYIAQGAKHLEVRREGTKVVAVLSDSPLVSGHRPSADVLFASVATVYQNHVLGVIMTGMGRDGAQQLGTVYREGGLTLGQDEGSAVVYGMPRVAFEYGHVMEQVPLDKMGQRICEVSKTGRL